ncbi:MAG: lytic transglycosylase domain-containing protein [Elusimicrobiota bacterium]
MKNIFKRIFLGFSILLLLFFVIRSDWFWNLLKPIIHKEILNRYAGEYKIDPLFVAAIIRAESNFSLKAESSAGAVGLMQILPTTAEELAGELNLPNYRRDDLYLPDINIRLGYHYLAKLKKEFNNDNVAVLAAYNAGNGKVHQWLKEKNRLTIEEIPFKETRLFVAKVLKDYRRLRNLRKFRNRLNFKFERSAEECKKTQAGE